MNWAKRRRLSRTALDYLKRLRDPMVTFRFDIVEVLLHDENAATVDAAKALFRDAPEVQQCYYVTGGTSFVLVILTADMRSYERLTRRLFAENTSVKSYRSLIALDRVKTSTALVLP